MMHDDRSTRFGSSLDQSSHAIPGVVIAGTVYAVVVMIAVSLVSTIENLPANFSFVLWFVYLFGMLFGTILFCVGTAFATCFILGFVSLASMAAITIFNLTLGYALSPLLAGSLIGGISGFISTCWVFAVSDYTTWRACLTIFLGPIAATVVCHIGAYYQTRKFQFLLAADDFANETLTDQKLLTAIKRFDESDSPFLDQPPAVAPSQATPSVHPLDEPDDVPLDQPSPPPAALRRNRSYARRGGQWSLRQGFVLTAWCGVLAAIGAAAPSVGSVAIILFGVYGAIQLVSFGVLLIVQKPIDRRLSRTTLKFAKSLQERESQPAN